MSNIKFIFSLVILIVLIIACSSGQYDYTEYDKVYKKNLLEARKLYKENKIIEAINVLEQNRLSSDEYQEAQLLLKMLKNESGKFYYNDGLKQLQNKNQKNAIDLLKKIPISDDTYFFLGKMIQDSIYADNYFRALEKQNPDDVIIAAIGIDSTNYYHLDIENATYNFFLNNFQPQEAVFSVLIKKFTNNYSLFEEVSFFSLKIDSVKDEKVYSKANDFYNNGDIKSASDELQKIKSNSLISAKVAVLYENMYNTIEKENRYIESKEYYYRGLFSKYKNVVTLLRKMNDMGFYQTKTVIGPTEDSNNSLISYYVLNDNGYTVTVKMWFNYALQWIWEVWVE